jgi:YidC/Oxa1 family membrane protein insertase
MNLGDLYFSIVTQPLLNLLQLLENLTHDTGIAIILIAAVINLALWPLFHKNYINSQKLKYLQPELDRIAATFKTSPQELMMARAETMRKHGVSTGTFWVVLLQIPFLISLYDIINKITQSAKIATKLGTQNYGDIITYIKTTDLNVIKDVVGAPSFNEGDKNNLIHILTSIYSFIKPDSVAQFGDKFLNTFNLGSNTSANGLWGYAMAAAVSISSLMLGLYMFKLAPKANLPEPPKAKPLIANKDPNAPDFGTTLQKSIEFQSIYIFPILYLFININLPVGLVLYFFGSSFSGLVRQFFITQYYATHGENLMKSIIDSDPTLLNPSKESPKIKADPAILADSAEAAKVVDVSSKPKSTAKKVTKKSKKSNRKK